MKILELFAGSRSFSKAAEKLGIETYTTDHKQFNRIDYVCNILDFDINNIPFKPTVIWASPPCTYFSVASIGHHWNKDNTPKTEQAALGVKIVQKTIDIIKDLDPKYFFIENPRGKLRKLDVIKHLDKTTVTYCQYGDTRMKPTDIWTNALTRWKPRPMCKNGMPCHEKAPRGSKTGTQGLKNNYERSIVPEQLCMEILNSIII